MSVDNSKRIEARTMMLFVAIGIVTGLLAGMLGIGGGVIIVPALILLAGYAPQTAVGTSLSVFLLPVGALGAWSYFRHGHVRIAPALIIASGLFVGSLFGAQIAHQMSSLTLKRVFAVLLIAVASKMWFGK